MALTNAQYDTIIKRYDEKQLRLHRRLEETQAGLRAALPEYAKLSDQIASLSVAYGRRLLDGDETALDSLREALDSLRTRRAALLADAGMSAGIPEPEYECKDCKDTGFIRGNKCHCFKQAEISLLYEQSNIQEILKTQNFSALSYEYYSGEDLLLFKNAVITCRGFIENFNSDYHNLFFYGTVGTGKTFLSNCIAGELMNLGHSVIYFSAAGLFDRISRSTFHKSSGEELSDLYEDLYTCDLLIIDDLGTELTNAFSSSRLFSCLNERILRRKSTIVSTNLSLEDLRDRYSDRIFSRITSHFHLCKITGPDIRMLKKRLSVRK
ncbi:MAG: ATP-binding protein [Lachnospiraceae bacterium]|nr:ATP-binding protein [Lachnospiraceae bacterium]